MRVSQQGAEANRTGKSFENEVRNFLVNSNYKPLPSPLYEALWYSGGNRKNQSDIWLKKMDTQLELKFQNVSGTVDQKAFSELYNASERIDCAHFILVFGGAHWVKGRGKSIYENAKQHAKKLTNTPSRDGARKLSAMTFDEFKEWIDEQS